MKIRWDIKAKNHLCDIWLAHYNALSFIGALFIIVRCFLKYEEISIKKTIIYG